MKLEDLEELEKEEAVDAEFRKLKAQKRHQQNKKRADRIADRTAKCVVFLVCTLLVMCCITSYIKNNNRVSGYYVEVKNPERGQPHYRWVEETKETTTSVNFEK